MSSGGEAKAKAEQVTQADGRRGKGRPPRVVDGKSTPERIVEAATDILLRQGFDGTSLDQVLLAAGVTKGAFFHHFKSKDDLGRAVMAGFVDADQKLAADLLARATKLTADPLEQVLLLVGLLAEMFDDLTEPHPGCLIASFCYQKNLMTEPLRDLAARSLLAWRDLIVERLTAASKTRPPAKPIALQGVADLLNTIVEGAFVMAKTLNDPKMIAAQLRHYRAYLELLFGK